MSFVRVPVIIACALGGTVGLLKLIQKFAPDSANIEGDARDRIERLR